MSTSPDNLTASRTGLLRSTGAFASMTLLSRVLGFVRDMVVAHTFGASVGMDAFLIAFKIPNFMRRLFAEGAFSQAFVPVLSEQQTKRSDEQVREFIGRVAGTLGTVLLIITLIAVIASPFLISLFAPGFEPGGERYDLASSMLRITFPYLMLISLTAMLAAVLNTYGSFAAPAFAPVLLNVSLILFALVFSPFFHPPIKALAWGVFAAGVAQLLFLIPFVQRKKLLPTPTFSRQDNDVKRVLKLMVPALFGVSVAQINLMLDTIFASFLPVGSVSWLYFSDRLMNFPLGVFGVAIATVILPHLSRHHAKQDQQAYAKSLDWSLRLILLIAIPSSIGLFYLAGPLLATLFSYGKFTAFDVQQARLSLMAYAIGVPAFMLIKALASGFYAKQNIKTPVKVGVIAMVVNVILNLILIKPFAHQGLAAATAIAAMVNAILLLAILLKQKIYQPQEGWLKFLVQLTFASCCMLALIGWLSVPLPEWLSWSASHRIAQLLLIVFGGAVLYFIALMSIGLKPKKILAGGD